MPPAVAGYGSWPSPITTDLIVAETIAVGQPWIDGDDVYWVEGRPSEGGRNVRVPRFENSIGLRRVRNYLEDVESR